MRTSGAALVSLLALILACTEADEVKCQPGYGLCGSGCISLLDDDQNCGACGNACGASQTCSAGACVARPAACADSLRAPIADRWGNTWDGLERAAATQPDAEAACAAFGGRLPIATEAYRVSWLRGADVGRAYNTNWLWTLVPRDPVSHVMARLSDGAISWDANVSARLYSYRCVCPAPMPPTFTGAACNGPPGDACIGLTGPNAGSNLDRQDRAPLTVGAAVWECNFGGAQLPRWGTYAEAILQGAPDGSGAWLHTADFIRYDLTSVIRWAGSDTGWAPSPNTARVFHSEFWPFRCVGRATATEPSASRPAGAFVGPTNLSADAADRASAGWAAAHSACWSAGGHLPYSTELGSLVQRGLGGGTNAPLWTADQEGHNGTQFLAGDLYWTDQELGFGLYYPDFISWVYKTDASHAYRCAYYPVDPAYVPPTSCNGGCFEVPHAGAARMWLDASDRTAAVFIAAVDICRGVGGHLATPRDLTEAIRGGLANGTNSHLHAVDLVSGNSDHTLTMITRWTGSDTNFDDQYGGFTTWEEFTDSRPFRCMWTNELR